MEEKNRQRRGKAKYCGRCNIAGLNIKRIRESLAPKCSQNDLTQKLQLEGLNVHKNMVQQVESGEQGLNDVELFVFAKVLGVSMADLLDTSIYNNVDHIDQTANEYSKSSYGYGTRSVAEK